jgi:hypothetical protein
MKIVFLMLPAQAAAWNIPANAERRNAYQVLQRESHATIPTVRSTLEKHPWCEAHWKAQLEKMPQPSAMKCFSCSPHDGPTTSALRTAPKASLSLSRLPNALNQI